MTAKPKTAKQVYERLDRHIRTSASLRELAHWDEERERSASRLTRPHDAALRKEIKARFLELNGGGA